MNEPDDTETLIQVGRVTSESKWRLPWRPEWRIVACNDCGHDCWISPKGREIKAAHPDARIGCSDCWPAERIAAEIDEVTEL